jgi:hypothetical protein
MVKLKRLVLVITIAMICSSLRAQTPATSSTYSPNEAATAEGQYDVIIRHGRIIDGSGNPWVSGDIALRGDRIALIRQLSGFPCETRNRRFFRPGRLPWLYRHARPIRVGASYRQSFSQQTGAGH